MNANEQENPCRIAILISGRGSNMLALADAVRAGEIAGAEVAVVISDRAEAAGLAHARERGIDALAVERRGRTREAHEREIIEALRARGVRLVCLAGYMRLLSPVFVGAYRGRVLNIHPSLLPAFPGLDAQRQALAHGVKVTGCTVHFVDETLDGGPIVEQRVVPVRDDDTEHTLAARILNIHPSLLPAFPGLDAQRQAIEHGVKASGCTVHFVDETLDGGPIITQRVVPVHDDDTPDTLAARILVEEHLAYTEAVALVVGEAYEIKGRSVLKR
ncbi:MAG TPA: phosphoribosylglycinamide formyltransferase [Pyrinomonadaceae bacterium]|nr:phosphoribosylglycinamide formyltransferase [Pyrinomonadaceae bacterium]